MQTETRHTIVLTGCAPVPLAHYLKALGILRLVSEQADPGARGFWRGDAFVLLSSLDPEALSAFFLTRYVPTPIIAPWNGGSGFSPKDNSVAIEAIAQGHADRLVTYRATIATARKLRSVLGIAEKLEKDQKDRLLQSCRSYLPDATLPWLDAAYVLTEEGSKYPPLLGTGGNDGRLDFTNNFMQRLCDLLDPATGNPTSPSLAWLHGAFFNTAQDGLQKGSAIGQFFPGAAGGANATTGFDADPLINPWDFVLMLEGALLFAAAGVKRLESPKPGVLSYPFSVRQTGVGYGSAATSDEKEARAEMWLPLWNQPAGLAELKALFSEGRAQLGDRSARNGVDFARAVASLGTDRGIHAFQRFGFQVRNGLAYFATPLDRIRVKRQPQVELLAEIDGWLDAFRGKASSDTAPAAAGRALRRLESAILALCREKAPRRLQDVLVALGECEATMARSLKWTISAYLRPIPPLGPGWLAEADDGSSEFRLAAALASLYSPHVGPLRCHMEPVAVGVKEGHAWARFQEAKDRSVVWHAGDLHDNLLATLQRRMLEASSGDGEVFPGHARRPAALGDVTAFIEGRVDDIRVSELLWGLILLDWPAIPRQQFARGPAEPLPAATYALTKLCHYPGLIRGLSVPMLPDITRRLETGDALMASRLAVRRLRGAGLPPAVEDAGANRVQSLRTAAALLIPISESDAQRLSEFVLKTPLQPTH